MADLKELTAEELLDELLSRALAGPIGYDYPLYATEIQRRLKRLEKVESDLEWLLHNPGLSVTSHHQLDALRENQKWTSEMLRASLESQAGEDR